MFCARSRQLLSQTPPGIFPRRISAVGRPARNGRMRPVICRDRLGTNTVLRKLDGSVRFRTVPMASSSRRPMVALLLSRRDAPGGRAPFLAFYAAFPTRAFAAAARQLQPAGRNFRVARWDVNSSKRRLRKQQRTAAELPRGGGPGRGRRDRAATTISIIIWRRCGRSVWLSCWSTARSRRSPPSHIFSWCWRTRTILRRCWRPPS